MEALASIIKDPDIPVDSDYVKDVYGKLAAAQRDLNKKMLATATTNPTLITMAVLDANEEVSESLGQLEDTIKASSDAEIVDLAGDVATVNSGLNTEFDLIAQMSLTTGKFPKS